MRPLNRDVALYFTDGDLMSLVNTPIKPFSATAYKAGEFVDITEADVKGKWAIFFFYPADFTFVCPTELEDLQDEYANLQSITAGIWW